MRIEGSSEEVLRWCVCPKEERDNKKEKKKCGEAMAPPADWFDLTTLEPLL
jgi:hypothetical protein